MELLLIAVAALVAVGVAAAFWSRPSSKAPSQTQAPPAPMPVAARAREPGSHPRGIAPLAPVDPPPPPRQLPPELASFVPLRARDLPAERHAVIVEVFHDVPRPPRLLNHLLSPDFVREASSSELADLIAAEPLIAAKVLATINSPLYGLRTSVSSVEQAVTLLGLTSVRAICLQYLLIASFQGDDAERKAALDGIWNASALASELAHRLALALGMHDAGSIVSSVVLSFLGRLATTARMPHGVLATIPTTSLLERARAEQAKMGLTSSEIGRVLMAQWGLPADVVDDAAGVDAVLVTADDAWEPVQASRRALGYLCARLGERLAQGQLACPADFDLESDPSPDWFHLQSYLGNPRLAQLAEHLRSPLLNVAVQKMLRSVRADHAEPAAH